MANRSFIAQASRSIFFGLLWLGFSCGGRAASGSFAGDTGGTPNMAGAGGAVSRAGTTSVAGAGGSDWAACVTDDTCLLLPQTSCGPGCEPVPLSRFVLVNAKYETEYYRQQLQPPCIDIGCNSPPLGSANIPNYYAACVAGRCQGFDVRTSPLSACSVGLDCYVRAGTTCCGCGSDNPIALSSKVDVEAAFCGAGHACDADCTTGPWPRGVGAYCSSGHCLLKVPDPISAGGAPP